MKDLHPDVRALIDHLAEELKIFAEYDPSSVGVVVRAPFPMSEAKWLWKASK